MGGQQGAEPPAASENTLLLEPGQWHAESVPDLQEKPGEEPAEADPPSHWRTDFTRATVGLLVFGLGYGSGQFVTYQTGNDLYAIGGFLVGIGLATYAITRPFWNRPE